MKHLDIKEGYERILMVFFFCAWLFTSTSSSTSNIYIDRPLCMYGNLFRLRARCLLVIKCKKRTKRRNTFDVCVSERQWCWVFVGNTNGSDRVTKSHASHKSEQKKEEKYSFWFNNNGVGILFLFVYCSLSFEMFSSVPHHNFSDDIYSMEVFSFSEQCVS